MGEIKGYISQVIGPVVDIHFDYGTEETVTLPRIHDAMEISRPNGKILIVEVQQHIGENTVRTVAMDTTDGLRPCHTECPSPCRPATKSKDV